MNKANGQPGKNASAWQWAGQVLSAEDLRQGLNGQGEVILSPRTVVTPMALDLLRANRVRIVRQPEDAREQREKAAWGYALEKPDAQVGSAIQSLAREGLRFKPLAAKREGESSCGWARAMADCIARGECQGGIAFCQDPGLVCCIANKLTGLRAVAVANVNQANRAVNGLAANLVVVEMPGRTFFEIRQILRCVSGGKGSCPNDIVSLLKELEGHAHR